MEIQHVCVPMAEYFWQRLSGPFAQQGPMITNLIRQCVWWMIVFLAFQLFKLRCELQQRKPRLTEESQRQADSERKGVEQFCLYFLKHANANARAHGGAAPPLESPPLQISVSMSVVADDDGETSRAVDVIPDDRRWMVDAASQMQAPGAEVTVLQSAAGPVVQTKLTSVDPSIASLRFGDTAATKKGKSLLIQLGRWQMLRTNTVGGEEARLLKVDDTDPVPWVWHSSYSGGILTVVGLHLRGATIQATTENKCVILEAKCCGDIECVAGDKGSCQVEVFTSETGLPSQNLAEVCVLASKKIDVDGFKLSVNSSAVRIQNDSLRTVIRSIFPFTILAICATFQILSTISRIMDITNVASVTAWLLPCIVVIATQALPLRIETTITAALKKVVVRTYLTIYFAAQCFRPDEDPGLSNVHLEEPSSPVREQPQVLKSGKWGDSRVTKNGDSLTEEDVNAHHISLDDPAWEWAVYDSKNEEKLVKRGMPNKRSNQARQPFAVIYHNIVDFPWAYQVEVCVFSPILIEIINAGEVSPSARCKKKVSLHGPDLFRIREKLRNECTSTADSEILDQASSTEKLLHLTHLVSFMEKEFREIEPVYVAMNSGKYYVSWEMLWAFFPPGERVVYLDDATDEKVCGDVLGAKYKMNYSDHEPFFSIRVTKWDYNCRDWKQSTTTLTFAKFEGEREILSLDAHPLRCVETPETLLDEFLQNGSRFCELSMKKRCCFRDYKGSLIRYKRMDSCLRLLKEKADGRVMIDLASFAKMNPAYPTLGSAKPPCDVIRDNDVTTHDITLSENRMFAPAMVYGFSFRLKKWGSFSVCGFSEIRFNSSAFEDLVMEEDTKDLVEVLVRKHLEDGKDTNLHPRSERLDTIASKGEGIIFLCYGPPGTGKTLTAESLSEKLECPLVFECL